MKKLLIILFVLFQSKNVFCQNPATKSGDTIGAIFNERIDVYDVDGERQNLKIPDKGHYYLVYRYKGTDPRKVETLDSVKLLEEKISTILLGGMVGNLKVICLSYGSSAEFTGWSEKIKKEKPFKPSSKYIIEYFNLNGNKISENRCREIFSKVTLFGPDGKFLSYSSTISRFRYHLKDEQITIKGKIVTHENGINEPLNDVDVHVESGNKDTLAKGKTDKYGDFSVKIPNNDTAYTIKANPKNKNIKNIYLLTHEGKKIAHLIKIYQSFEYKLMKADLLDLAEMDVEEDIDLTFKKFEGSANKELWVIEDIIYEKDQFFVSKETEWILNKVVTILKKNETVKLEILSHTDAQGEDGANKTLSQKRANAVADYLIGNGIAKGRIFATGKGESEIRNRCGNGINCTDKEHGYNRRTVFKFNK